MTDTPSRTSTSATLVLSVHGAAGALDLVVPSGATSVDVAREYAKQTGLASIPLLQTPVGGLIDAGRSLVEAGVAPGDVLVATSGVHRGSATTAPPLLAETPDTGPLASLVAWVAVGFAMLSAWYAARSGDDVVRTVTVGVLLACALAGALPWGRHARERAAAAPAFGAGAALAALYGPGAHLLPAVIASVALAAAMIASIARALAPGPIEAATVWIAGGVATAVACAISPAMGWQPQVSWTLILLFAMLASRFGPSLAIDVPDEALLDLDRLAVTAWSARDSARGGRRNRLVVAGDAMGRLVEHASRTLTATAAAILVTAVGASALLLATVEEDLDRLGARWLVFLAGGGILFAARSYRHVAARGLLRLAALIAWIALAVDLVVGDIGPLEAFLVVVLLLGAAVLGAAVASGRGWRSVWWSRRAEVGEALCGSLAFAAAVVSSGVFRILWEITS